MSFKLFFFYLKGFRIQTKLFYIWVILVLRNYFLLKQIKPGSIAEKVGLKVKDSLVKIGNDCALDYTIEEAMESLKKNKMFFDMIVER